MDSVALGIRAVYYRDDPDAGYPPSQVVTPPFVSVEMGTSFFPAADGMVA